MRNTRPTGYLSVYTRNVHSTSASFPIPKCFFYNVHRASKKFCAEGYSDAIGSSKQHFILSQITMEVYL
eukprot:scaffold58205_cov26-Tisochrysis_lutea.AAC.1